MTNAVDIEAISEQKENVLPLSTGRSAAKLTGLLSRDRKAVESELKEGHAKFQQEIDQIEADFDNVEDALDVYHRYVRWTLSSYPSGPSHASHLVPLLEKTTRRFVRDPRYKSDIRYLRLWILYSKYIDSPRDVFRFLEANSIGLNLASFYEEWALVEEAASHLKEAESIYTLGVNRKAEPLSRLKKRRDVFRTRMASMPQRDTSDSSSDDRSPGSHLRSSRGPGLSQSRLATAPAASVVAKPNGPAFAVFSDENGALSGSREGQWDDMGTRDERRRENHVDATPWVGERLPMPIKAVASAEKIQVFRDDDAPAPSSTPSGEHVLNTRPIRGPSEAESLRANPFKYYDQAEISGLVQTQPASLANLAQETSTKTRKEEIRKATPLIPSASKKASSSSSKEVKKERVASALSEVYPEDELGQPEYSFEEIYAIRRGLHSRDGTKQQALWDKLQQQEWLVQASESGEPFQVTNDGHAVLYDGQGRGTFEYIRQRQDAEELAARKQREPSPTMITKQAMAEVNDMFGATMNYTMNGSPSSSRSGHSARSGSTTEDEDESGFDESDRSSDTPLPTSQASEGEGLGDYINDSFWGPVASQSQYSEIGGSQQSQREPYSKLLDNDDKIDEEDDTPSAKAPFSQPQHRQAPAFVPFSDSENDSRALTSSARTNRRPLAESRFAPMVDMMTPIVERTAEYNRLSMGDGLTGDFRMAKPLVEASEDEDDAIDNGFILSQSDGSTQQSPSSAADTSEAATIRADASETFVSGEISSLRLSDGFTISGNQSQMETNMMVVNHATVTTTSPNTFPNPCYPQSQRVISAIVDSKSDPLPNCYQLNDEFGQLAVLQKRSKKQARKSASQDEEGLLLDLGKDGYSFSVREKLGEGGFGAVFRVAKTDMVEEEDGGFYALKATSKPSIWEYYVLHEIRTRLQHDDRAIQSIIEAHALFNFADEAYLVLEVCDQGTLLEAVNAAATSGLSPLGGAGGLEESLAIFFVVELLRVIESLHRAGFVHADFKIDNVLVRLEDVPGGTKAWTPAYKADGSGGWSCKGVKLIDYGRAIDLFAFPPNQTFKADFDADGRDCLYMRQNKPWTFHPDYHGLATIAFTLLFGKHLEAEHTVYSPSGNGLVLAGKPFRRYHQVDMWTRLFALLLDPPTVPCTDALARIRQEMEAWLTAQADKGGRTLKSLLKKLEIAQLTR